MLLLALLACDESPYGPYASAVRALEKKLETNPCDSASLLELTTTLTNLHMESDAAGRLAAARGQCPPDGYLADAEYKVAITARLWDQAAAIATIGVVDDPSATGPRLERAVAYEGAGKWDDAVTDLRQAMLLSPKVFPTGENLAKDQEKAGHACDAWETWGLIWWRHKDKRGEAQIQRGRLTTDAGCGALRVDGQARLKHTDTIDGWYTFDLMVGDTPARIGVDSSSPYTIVSADLAQKLALPTATEPLITRCFLGTMAGRLTRLPPVHLGDIEVKELDALVADTLPEGVDGMLGINFLTRVDMDRDGKLWRFSARRI